MEYGTQYGRTEICYVCGKEFFSATSVHQRQFCPECFEKYKSEHDALVKEYANIKLKIMHETALRKLEKSRDCFDFRDFREAIEAVEQMERIKPDAFLSSEEIITAISLYSLGYDFKVNYKILKYKVDFYLPEEKIILEVDSSLHDIGNTKLKDGRRDVEIRYELGNEWEIVRISTSFVAQHPLMIANKAIEMANKQRELRKKNHGFLPYNYSKSVKAYYDKVLS
jgi:very-short-patch-repair endonuclease